MYLSWGERPEEVSEKFADVRRQAEARGRRVRFGLRAHIIVRETEEEAWREADRLIAHLTDEQIAKAQAGFAASESVGQQRMARLHQGDRDKLRIGRNLWAGVGLVRGGAGTAFVGAPENIARALSEYRDAGVETFILSGYPHLGRGIPHGGVIVPGHWQAQPHLSDCTASHRYRDGVGGLPDHRAFQLDLTLITAMRIDPLFLKGAVLLATGVALSPAVAHSRCAEPRGRTYLQ